MWLATPARPGENTPADRRISVEVGVIVVEARPGEDVPADLLIVVGTGADGKRYRRLKEGDRVERGQVLVIEETRTYRPLKVGDWVEKGQLLAQVDPSLALKEVASKYARLKASERERQSAEAKREETRARYETGRRLVAGGGMSREEYSERELAYEHHRLDVMSKAEAVTLAEQELSQAWTVLKMHEIRSDISGVIKAIFKKEGEAVKELESVLLIHDPQRLRIEGQMPAQYLPLLEEMKRRGEKLVIEPACLISPGKVLNGHLHQVTGVAVSNDPDNPRIASSSQDRTVRVWDRASGREQLILRHPAEVWAVACTPPGAPANLCLSGAADGQGRLWDLTKGSHQEPRLLTGGHRRGIRCVAFSPDGRWCATGGEDHAICLWETATGRLCYRFPAGHVGEVTSMQFTADSQLVSAGADNRLLIWGLGVKGAHLVKTGFGQRNGGVTALGASPDGKRVLFDQGKELRVLSIPEGRTEGILEKLSGAARFMTLAVFSPDGNLILTASDLEGPLQLWRVPVGTVRSAALCQLAWTGSPATCGAFAPDGSFAITGMKDRQVLIWSILNQSELAQEIHAEIVLVERSHDGSSRQVRVWAELENPGGHVIPGTPAIMTAQPGAIDTSGRHQFGDCPH